MTHVKKREVRLKIRTTRLSHVRVSEHTISNSRHRIVYVDNKNSSVSAIASSLYKNMYNRAQEIRYSHPKTDANRLHLVSCYLALNATGSITSFPPL